MAKMQGDSTISFLVWQHGLYPPFVAFNIFQQTVFVGSIFIMVDLNAKISKAYRNIHRTVRLDKSLRQDRESLV